jgi:hypothetical protein
MDDVDRSDDGLPPQDEGEEAGCAFSSESSRDEAKAWSQLSTDSFARDWDSDADAIYDEFFTPSTP